MPTAHFDTHPEANGQMQYTTEMNEEEVAEINGVLPSRFAMNVIEERPRDEKTETSYPVTQRSGDEKPHILMHDACLKGSQ